MTGPMGELSDSGRKDPAEVLAVVAWRLGQLEAGQNRLEAKLGHDTVSAAMYEVRHKQLEDRLAELEGHAAQARRDYVQLRNAVIAGIIVSLVTVLIGLVIQYIRLH